VDWGPVAILVATIVVAAVALGTLILSRIDRHDDAETKARDDLAGTLSHLRDDVTYIAGRLGIELPSGRR
jgi:hypothetical protein